MSWISTLNRTYNNAKDLVGVKDEKGCILLPLSHSTAEAQVEIIINLNGKFLRVNRIEKQNATTVIPVTEDSATRSSGISPMPLCDNLKYIAGDFDRECRPSKSMYKYFEAYCNELRKWNESEYTTKEIKAVYDYIIGEHVVADLKKAGAYESPDDFVRFLVYDESTGIQKSVSDNREVQENFHLYYTHTMDDKEICFVSGNEAAVAHKFPAKIRNTGDKAKLISSNDTQGYTFRGRFKTASEAVSVSYEVSQKAHNALRWLIKKQGYRNGSECIVCWSSGGDEVLNVMEESDILFGFDEDEAVDTAENYAKRVNKAISGYKSSNTDFAEDKNINVMAVDTADGSGQGRLSIVYYGEFLQSVFYENIEYWYSSCMWRHNYRKNEKGQYNYYFGTPSPKEIVLSAYGTEQGGLLKADEKVQKKGIDRILPCITQKKHFPKDMMYAAVRNAGSPLRFSGYNWNRILTNTCSLIRKCQIDDRKEGYDMVVDDEVKKRDRDYQFGRLLAILNQIERVTYFSDGNSRETNAMKYWSAFSRNPARTFAVLRDRLVPYISKLYEGQKNKYEILIEEVLHNLTVINGYTNDPLKENYLLGYYNQDAAFRSTAKEKEDEER